MKAIFRRLQRLESRFVVHVDELVSARANILEQRRRARLQVAGLPYEDPPSIPASGPIRYTSIREGILEGRRQARERRERERAALEPEMATDIH
jgi:hypothetical protein